MITGVFENQWLNLVILIAWPETDRWAFENKRRELCTLLLKSETASSLGHLMSVEYLFAKVSSHIAKGEQVKGAVLGLQTIRIHSFSRCPSPESPNGRGLKEQVQGCHVGFILAKLMKSDSTL